MLKSMSTRFAPAERSPEEVLQRQAAYFSEEGLTRHLLDAIPSILLILNNQRQIVYGNRALFDLLGVQEVDFTSGLRPGEILSCINARREPGGCGTGEPCSACGMVAAILNSLAGRKEIRECRFLRHKDGRTEAIDLLVWATPLEYRGETFAIFALSDISHEKRRRVLEKIFFHDVLNVIGSIRGLAELLQTYDPADRRDLYAMIQEAANQTIEEIEAQRILTAAESKELQARPEPVSLQMFVPSLLEIYRYHEVGRGRQVSLETSVPETVLVTDRTLLGRILGNMLKNALEATEPGETVRFSCFRRAGRIDFTVHNRSAIPPAEQMEIFQRSFSTKGQGRGLGTYSMKVLSEYIGGEISFSSSEETGTTFRLTLPLVPSA